MITSLPCLSPVDDFYLTDNALHVWPFLFSLISYPISPTLFFYSLNKKNVSLLWDLVPVHLCPWNILPLTFLLLPVIHISLRKGLHSFPNGICYSYSRSNTLNSISLFICLHSSFYYLEWFLAFLNLCSLWSISHNKM